MSHAIPAVFDSGVFRPLQPVDLAEGTRAEVIPLPDPTTSSPDRSAERTSWPSGYFAQTAGALAAEQFERPLQGELPKREGW
jgi:predicted DNA-binding antitoxin AbrB/MazE fold protein